MCAIKMFNQLITACLLMAEQSRLVP
jgi:hypothetical protein